MVSEHDILFYLPCGHLTNSDSPLYVFISSSISVSLTPSLCPTLSDFVMFKISTNAPAARVEMKERALTLSTRTRVAVSPVTREHTARQVSQ